MPRNRKKEETTIKEIKAPLPPVTPLYSNFVATLPHKDMVMVDFGFIGPSYCEPYDFEDNHVARICVDWDAVENLASHLNEALLNYKKKKKKS